MPTKIILVFKGYIISNYPATITYESMLSDLEIPQCLKGINLLLEDVLANVQVKGILQRIVIEPVEIEGGKVDVPSTT